MKNVNIMYTVIISFLLLGCDSAGNFGVEGSPAWHNRTSSEDKAAYFGKICKSYGFKAGTDSLYNCIAEETRQSVKSGRAAMAAALQDLGTPKTDNNSFDRNDYNRERSWECINKGKVYISGLGCS